MASTGFKVFTAAATAAAGGVAAIGTAAIKSYADFEQLSGGAELLWGEAYSFIADKASNAYATVQMSQNEYLTQVNGLSVGLTNALGGNAAAAAELADKVITAEADIVAATGNTQESVQNAFNGIMKGNFTMVDNLGLGITATKEGFQEMINSVNAYNEAHGEATNYQIDNVADCQAALVKYVEMQGMAGYAGAEAADTIQGSTAMMKASWSNLLTGMADDNADFGALIDDFVESIVAVGENLLPRIETVLGGIGSLIEQLLPVIIARVPEILNNILPDLIQAGVNMISAILTGLQQNLPLILSGGAEILTTLIGAILQMLPMLAETAYTLVMELANGVIDNIGDVASSGSETLLSFIEGIVEKLPELIETAVDLVVEVATALTEPNTLTNIIESGIQLITTLMWALVDAIPTLLSAVPTIIGRLVATLIENAPRLVTAAIELLVALGAALVSEISQLLTFIPDVATSIIDAFKETDWGQIGQNIIDGIWAGISAGWDWLVGGAKDLAAAIFGGAKEELDINSPSRKFKWLGEMCVAGWEEGSEGLMDVDGITKNVRASFGTMKMNAEGSNAHGGVAGFNQTININQPISTPDEMARAMRLEARYGLMTG